MKNNTKIKSVLVSTAIAVALIIQTGCGGSSKVDKALDDYESFIGKYESFASSKDFDLNKLNEMNSATIKFSQQIEQVQASDKWTEKQLQRMMDLNARQLKASQSMMDNMKKK